MGRHAEYVYDIEVRHYTNIFLSSFYISITYFAEYTYTLTQRKGASSDISLFYFNLPCKTIVDPISGFFRQWSLFLTPRFISGVLTNNSVVHSLHQLPLRKRCKQMI